VNRKKLQAIMVETDGGSVGERRAGVQLRRFHHAAVEVSGTYISKRHALHMLLDAGMRSLGNDVVRAAKGSR
jgi:hypothetical protein